MFVIGLIVLAFYWGTAFRRFTWEITSPIHFRGDIQGGGYAWGTAANGPEGFLNIYERMRHQRSGYLPPPTEPDGSILPANRVRWNRWLDYAPLRLSIMTLWAGHNQRVFKDQSPENWRDDYDFNRPVLLFNTAMELMGAVCAFFIVRMWVIRKAYPAPTVSWPKELWLRFRGASPPMLEPVPAHAPFTGWAAGLIAALALWFNPAMVISAHGWPTWDMWIVPMYLLAIMLASYDFWLFSGLVMGLGVMFKGQQLVGAPVFLAWTLLLGRISRAVGWVCGFCIAIAAVASPWILTIIPPDKLEALWNFQSRSFHPWEVRYVAERVWNGPAILWALGVLLASVAAPLVRRLKNRRIQWSLFAAIGLLLAYPIFHRHDTRAVAMLLAGLAAFALATWFCRRWRSRVTFSLTSVAISILLGLLFFNGSTAWWDCGIRYGTQHWRKLVMGVTSNLPGILANRYGWSMDDLDEIAFKLDAGNTLHLISTPIDVSVQAFLQGLFVLAMIPCLWGVARHARRNDPRFLVAITAPWLVFFCFPPQIHERYLLFAAGVGAILIGQSVGMFLLSLLMTIATWCMTIHVMLNAGDRGGFGRLLANHFPDWMTARAGFTMRRIMEGLYPDIGYGIVLMGLIFIYVCVRSTPARRLPPENKQ